MSNLVIIVDNKYVTMRWTIEYPYKDVKRFIAALPPGLRARYVQLSDALVECGSNLGMPHTRSMSNGFFELRMKSKEGTARILYCTMVGKRIILLHGFVKKSQKTPLKELRIARHRLVEVKKNGA